LTVSVPRRIEGSTLVPTRYPTAPLPWPVVSPVNVTQAAALAASHVQSRVVVTVRVPLPPVAGIIGGELSTVTWHFDDEGPVTDRSAELQAAAPIASIAATTNRRAEAREQSRLS